MDILIFVDEPFSFSSYIYSCFYSYSSFYSFFSSSIVIVKMPIERSALNAGTNECSYFNMTFFMDESYFRDNRLKDSNISFLVPASTILPIALIMVNVPRMLFYIIQYILVITHGIYSTINSWIIRMTSIIYI